MFLCVYTSKGKTTGKWQLGDQETPGQLRMYVCVYVYVCASVDAYACAHVPVYV